MLKKTVLALIIVSLALCAVSCTEKTKTLTCDGCGNKVEVEIDSNMNEDWIIFCEECGEPETTFKSPFEQ